MSELVEFLRARLDDDEERARFVQREQGDRHEIEPWRLSWHDEYDLLCIEPSRALAEVDAKRKLIDKYDRLLASQRAHDKAVAVLDADIAHEEETGRWEGVGSPDVRQRALRREADYLSAMRPILEELITAAAAVYAGEPGYRGEWRP